MEKHRRSSLGRSSQNVHKFGKSSVSNLLEERFDSKKSFSVSTPLEEQKRFSVSIGLRTFSFEKGSGSKKGFVLIRERNSQMCSSIWVSFEGLNFLRKKMSDYCSRGICHSYSFVADKERFTVEISRGGKRKGKVFVKISGTNQKGRDAVIFFPSGGWGELLKTMQEFLKDNIKSGFYINSEIVGVNSKMVDVVKSKYEYSSGGGNAAMYKAGDDKYPDWYDEDDPIYQSAESVAKKFSHLLEDNIIHSLSPFGETDVESCDGEDDDDKSEAGSDVVVCEDGAWEDTILEINAEINQWCKEEEEKKVEEKKKKIGDLPFNRKMRSFEPTEPKGRVVYRVYVDAYFRQKRKPRFAIVMKDPSLTIQLKYVGESTSRHVPQLHTHLEGMLRGAELAKEYIDNEGPREEEIEIYIHSNSSYAVGFVNGEMQQLKDEHFTVGVKNLLKKFKVYAFTNNMSVSWVTYCENRVADYLARSKTLKPGKILKGDFDEGLEAIIEEDERYFKR